MASVFLSGKELKLTKQFWGLDQKKATHRGWPMEALKATIKLKN